MTVKPVKAPRYGGGHVTGVVGVDLKSEVSTVPVRPSRVVIAGGKGIPDTAAAP